MTFFVLFKKSNFRLLIRDWCFVFLYNLHIQFCQVTRHSFVETCVQNPVILVYKAINIDIYLTKAHRFASEGFKISVTIHSNFKP